MTGKDKLDHYLDTVEHLPARPTVMVKLMGLFRQPDRDVDDIVELMRQDVSVTAELLRRCNKSFFGNEEPVTDVSEAVFRLGFYEVYRIIVALFGRQAISAGQAAKRLPVDNLWQHSADTALAAGSMARELGESESDVFTAGLLHDVGRFVLASSEGSEYAGMLREHGRFGAALNEAEKTAFGFSHAEVGARLLDRWNVPAPVADPVRLHHQMTWSGPHERPVAIVSLADFMVHCIEQTIPDQPCEWLETVPAMELLDLKPNDMPDLEQLSRNEIKCLGPLLATDVPR